ncbi:MAG: toll/interleukin-1 receptor domain-containing protein [Terriglobia bacterium]|jgi:hypothetical protein
MRVFISYGHDEHAGLAVCIKRDLESRGHEVWFDLECLKSGADRERYIEDVRVWVSASQGEGRIILFITPHSVCRPLGYCLNWRAL